jgi:hypothetical protein
MSKYRPKTARLFPTKTSPGIWYGCSDEDIDDMVQVELDQSLAAFMKESPDNPGTSTPVAKSTEIS